MKGASLAPIFSLSYFEAMKNEHPIVAIRKLLYESDDALRRAERAFHQNPSESALVSFYNAAKRANRNVYVHIVATGAAHFYGRNHIIVGVRERPNALHEPESTKLFSLRSVGTMPPISVTYTTLLSWNAVIDTTRDFEESLVESDMDWRSAERRFTQSPSEKTLIDLIQTTSKAGKRVEWRERPTLWTRTFPFYISMYTHYTPPTPEQIFALQKVHHVNLGMASGGVYAVYSWAQLQDGLFKVV